VSHCFFVSNHVIGHVTEVLLNHSSW